jgi:hypothetical protein
MWERDCTCEDMQIVGQKNGGGKREIVREQQKGEMRLTSTSLGA